jgi:hypothetical protein
MSNRGARRDDDPRLQRKSVPSSVETEDRGRMSASRRLTHDVTRDEIVASAYMVARALAKSGSRHVESDS